MTYYRQDLEAKDQRGKSVIEIVQELIKLEDFSEKDMAKKLMQKFYSTKSRPSTTPTFLHQAVQRLDKETYDKCVSLGVQVPQLLKVLLILLYDLKLLF